MNYLFHLGKAITKSPYVERKNKNSFENLASFFFSANKGHFFAF